MSLDARGVAFAYPGCRPLFEDIALSLSPGERVALGAPSGRGKSTLCRILSGFETPSSGDVTLDGDPVRIGGSQAVQLLWQHPEQAVDPRVRMARSLGEAGDVRGERACELFDRFSVNPAWLSRFPGELSGGELMRCCVVRALMVRPRYLIADEVTAMLDAVTQASLMRALMDTIELEHMGLLFVSHSPALVDRVATDVLTLV